VLVSPPWAPFQRCYVCARLQDFSSRFISFRGLALSSCRSQASEGLRQVSAQGTLFSGSSLSFDFLLFFPHPVSVVREESCHSLLVFLENFLPVLASDRPAAPHSAAPPFRFSPPAPGTFFTGGTLPSQEGPAGRSWAGHRPPFSAPCTRSTVILRDILLAAGAFDPRFSKIDRSLARPRLPSEVSPPPLSRRGSVLSLSVATLYFHTPTSGLFPHIFCIWPRSPFPPRKRGSGSSRV